MKHLEFSWQTSEGLQIYLAEVFNQAGYAILTFDHRGHGRSQGRRGHIPTYEAFMDDIGQLLLEARQRWPGGPHFLYGHSMGGNLVLNHALRRRPRLNGVVVTAPWLRLVTSPPRFQVSLLGLVDRLYPQLSFSNRLDPLTLSRDPAVVRAYQTDPLVHDRISIRLFLTIDQSGQWAIAHWQRRPPYQRRSQPAICRSDS
jgi:alpha-beta hydrolase superfamily lysophospholipase